MADGVSSEKMKKKEPERVVVLRDNALNVYTDGSCLPHPRRGGMGIIFVTIDAAGTAIVEDVSPMGYKGGNSAQMELGAVIEALKGALELPHLRSFNEIYIVSDSQYVVKGIDAAKFIWPKQKWEDKNGRPIANVRMWKEMVRLLRKVPIPVRMKWVKGHGENLYNRIVDKLARESAEGFLRKSTGKPSVRKRLTKKMAKRGCIEMQSQTMDVHPYVGDYDWEHRLFKYTYEVLNEDSPFHGNADYIFSDKILAAGHFYRVRVNDTTPNPRIVEVVCELDKKTRLPMVEEEKE